MAGSSEKLTRFGGVKPTMTCEDQLVAQVRKERHRPECTSYRPLVVRTEGPGTHRLLGSC